jgi:hypothetical protein
MTVGAMMTKKVFKDGRWQDGKASPQALREDLAALPADYVTKEEGDAERIHELDPPHIVKALTRERFLSETVLPPEKPEDALTRAPLGKVVPLRQDFIDVEKLFVMKGIIKGQMVEIEEGTRKEPDLTSIWHLWFPENNVNNWVVRPGKPPPDSERPKHMRGFDLVVDVMNIPQRIVDELRKRGVDAHYFMDRIVRQQRQSALVDID